MSEFVFGVLCYNEESLIKETLESILYQVIEYGSELDVSLVIADDCSTDSSQEVIREWVSRKAQAFFDVICILGAENKGVVYNYQAILDCIGNRPFKIVAGDDLIASVNIFEKERQATAHSIDAYIPLFLKEDRVYAPKSFLFSRFYYMGRSRSKEYDLRMFRRGTYLSTPSTLYRAEAYRDSKAAVMNSKFSMFEDDPTFYSILKNLYDSRVRFREGSIVLYRIHGNSISNSGTPDPVFRKELDELNALFEKDSSGLERIYLKSSNRGRNKRIGFYALVDKLHVARMCLYCLAHFYSFKRFCSRAIEQAERERHFYYLMQERARV